MSYCRFTPDSDVYAYEDCYGGITVHVATNSRGEWWECPRPELTGDSESETDAFLAQYAARMAWCESHPGLPIGLPEDGETFSGELSEALDYLRILKRTGYLVPDYAIEAMRAELSEKGKHEKTRPL
jgi:hypothetical protein